MLGVIRSNAVMWMFVGGLLCASPASAQDLESESAPSAAADEIAEAVEPETPITSDAPAETVEGAEGAAGDAAQMSAQDVPDTPVAQPSGAADKSDWGLLQPFMNLVEAGGPIILILGLLSVVSLMIIVVKLIQFVLLRVSDHRFTGTVSQMLQAGKVTDALDFVKNRKGVVSRVMEAALIGKSLGFPEPIVREETERVARAKLDGLERGLSLLSLIATISPLLGLLGTVLGMIEAFQQLQNAGDKVDPAILSGGIWEALLTTAAGLTVAIPAAVFYTWLQRSVDVAAQHMEDAAVRVFTADLYVQGNVKPLPEDSAKAA